MTQEELLKYIWDNHIGIVKHIEEDKYGYYSTGVFKYKGMTIISNIENNRWHLSVSAKFPLGYQQLKDIRYNFMPNRIHVAQIFPPREEFVNLHTRCWHLWEIEN